MAMVDQHLEMVNVGAGETVALDASSRLTIGVNNGAPGHLVDIGESDAFATEDNM